ncbi:retrotransposon protein, putative, ty1-copia subclass [Tanacetum coccineum]
MHVYWASVLVIPKGIILDIQQHMRGFLWCNDELKRGKAKVAWDAICLPKREGGLGIRSLEQFNIALMTTHIWNTVTNKQSLSGSVLDSSFGVNLVMVRRLRFGMIDGALKAQFRYLSPRDITNEGYHLQNCVANLVSNEGWSWPQAWLLKAPDLGSIPVPVLVDSQLDKPQWRDINGNLSNFSVKCAWEALRPRDIEVPWHQLVWFSHCIPRHAFNLWLVMRNSLKTHDQLRQWDVGIFFSNMCMENVLPRLHDIVSHLQPLAHKRSAKSVIGRLLVAAASYFIWIERNNRIFKKVKRSPEDLCDTIMVTIRLKLLTFRFKNTRVVNELLSKWRMPSNFRLYV